jgi:hypothetical protein
MGTERAHKRRCTDRKNYAGRKTELAFRTVLIVRIFEWGSHEFPLEPKDISKDAILELFPGDRAVRGSLVIVKTSCRNNET